MSANPGSGPWWTEREVPRGEGLSFAIGTLRLSAYRGSGVWRIVYTFDDGLSLEQEGESSRIEPPIELDETTGTVERYAVGAERVALRCTPTMADRTVVVRPRIPLFVPPDEEIRIFVSSPVWIRLEVGKPWQSLRELPARRLSDTWLGSPTQEGHLAYALRSHARVRRDEIPERFHRAITPVVIHNLADDALAVQRINLPVPYLSLFATREHRFWTEAVTMTRSEGTELATLKIRKGAPPEAEGGTRVSEPRLASETNLLIRAFSTLFRAHADEDR